MWATEKTTKGSYRVPLSPTRNIQWRFIVLSKNHNTRRSMRRCKVGYTPCCFVGSPYFFGPLSPQRSAERLQLCRGHKKQRSALLNGRERDERVSTFTTRGHQVVLAPTAFAVVVPAIDVYPLRKEILAELMVARHRRISKRLRVPLLSLHV